MLLASSGQLVVKCIICVRLIRGLIIFTYIHNIAFAMWSMYVMKFSDTAVTRLSESNCQIYFSCIRNVCVCACVCVCGWVCVVCMVCVCDYCMDCETFGKRCMLWCNQQDWSLRIVFVSTRPGTQSSTFSSLMTPTMPTTDTRSLRYRREWLRRLLLPPLSKLRCVCVCVCVCARVRGWVGGWVMCVDVPL